MQQLTGVDSVVLQVTGDDLKTAKKIEVILGGQLEILKCSPIRPTKGGAKSWRGATGRAIPKSAAFIALLHHQRGQSIPIIRFGNGRGLELGFHGLVQYQKDSPILDDGSEQRRAILDEFLAVWDEPIRVTRFDRCADMPNAWSNYTNSREHRSLCKREGVAIFEKTTVYYQPKKPRYTKALGYSKRHANGLEYDLNRIEFRFLPQYWRTHAEVRPDEIIESAIIRTDSYIKRIFR